MTGQMVRVEEDGAIRTLTLDSPENRNALSVRLLRELAQAFLDATTDTSVRAIVLTGSGTVFCSGADLSQRDADAPTRLAEILTAMVRSRVPVITRVNGHTRAGGLGLIAASDMAVAATTSTFAFSEVRVGVAPAIIMVPALRVMDRRFLTRVTLTGEKFGAAEAVRVGLLTDVVEAEADLDSWTAGEVAALLKSAPGAVAATKELLGQLCESSWVDGLSVATTRSAALFAGPEAAEGMEAFLQKRTPTWDLTLP